MTVNDYADLFVQEPRLSESLKRELADQPHDPARYFIAAVLAYRHGNIKRCREYLAQALQRGFEWEEGTALDDAVQAALTNPEFHDFENIFLDASEASPQIRWLSLTLPVYEWLNARDDRRLERAKRLGNLCSDQFQHRFLAGGRDELLRIIKDLAQHSANAELVERLETHLGANDLPQFAELVLALILEHLGQFAEFFGLTAEEVRTSDLQRLVLNLPLRMAVAVILLYTVSRPQEMPGSDKNIKNDAPTAGLIAAAFITFYQQADAYRPAP